MSEHEHKYEYEGMGLYTCMCGDGIDEEDFNLWLHSRKDSTIKTLTEKLNEEQCKRLEAENLLEQKETLNLELVSLIGEEESKALVKFEEFKTLTAKCEEQGREIERLIATLIERDGGAHDVDCKSERGRGCNCGHDAVKALTTSSEQIKEEGE